jgi:hypothetical protein
MKSGFFEDVFEQARVANLTKAELGEYKKSLKRLKDMDIYKVEVKVWGELFVKEREAHKKAIAQKDSIIAEYERRYGVLK